MNGDAGRRRVSRWFPENLPAERPRRDGAVPPQPDWGDVSREWKGSVHRIDTAGRRQEGPRVRFPGADDERSMSWAFGLGVQGVDPDLLEPVAGAEYRPEDGIDLSRYRSS